MFLDGRLRYLLLCVGVFAAGCQEPISETEKRHREHALTFVELIANYTPEDVQDRFTKARTVLDGGAERVFGEGILAAEQAAALSTGRTQVFKPNVEEIASEQVSEIETLVQITGERTRQVGEKTSAPLQMTYLVRLKQVPVDEPGAVDDRVTEVQADFDPGQQKALTEEALLEKWNEASSAAQEERTKFKEAVSVVQEDLSRHQEKVEEDFKRLADSLDKLGSKVRKLGDDVRTMHDKPPEPKRKPSRRRPKPKKEAKPEPPESAPQAAEAAPPLLEPASPELGPADASAPADG